MAASFSDFIKHKAEVPNAKKQVKKVVSHHDEPKHVMKESKMENSAFNEAQVYIKNLKKKIDTVFYRFGMSGLEKIDEAIISSLNEMLSPSNKKPMKESKTVRKQARSSSVQHSEKQQTIKQTKESTTENALESSAKALLGALSEQAAFVPTVTSPNTVASTENDAAMANIEALSMALGSDPNEEN